MEAIQTIAKKSVFYKLIMFFHPPTLKFLIQNNQWKEMIDSEPQIQKIQYHQVGRYVLKKLPEAVTKGTYPVYVYLNLFNRLKAPHGDLPSGLKTNIETAIITLLNKLPEIVAKGAHLNY